MKLSQVRRTFVSSATTEIHRLGSRRNRKSSSNAEGSSHGQTSLGAKTAAAPQKLHPGAATSPQSTSITPLALTRYWLPTPTQRPWTPCKLGLLLQSMRRRTCSAHCCGRMVMTWGTKAGAWQRHWQAVEPTSASCG